MAETAITFDDVLLIPAYNHHESRRLVDTSVTDKSGRLKLGLPVMTANMDTVTEDAMANFIGGKGGIGILHRFCSVEENLAMFRRCSHPTFISVGTAEGEMERVEALRDAGADYFCVDVAHGHARYVGKMVKRIRQMIPEACIMAGNVATYAGADYLASVKADIVKVGIGPGSVCTTRIKTGFGVPQLTAIQECARADRSIVADGGIRTPGDIVKALAFGADFVMIGGMLAGTRPTPGEAVLGKDGRPCKVYRGMASKEAADDHLGGLTGWKTAEGVATTVPCREDEDEIIADIVGGLRSGLTYAGANTIRELQRKLNYVMVSHAGRIESLPHKTLER
ncbi:guanosine monophosphate reductase [Holophaga foetida]|uniref:guanosine monophosphate reductase n=1 Tax=Holophaga foetida TaxID=35839 RepID=UPI0002D40F05|nr:guanosine monophosphate reductase [Holophaga foetida]